MRKVMIFSLAIIFCFLLLLPGLGLAAESNSESTATLDEVVVTSTPLEQYLVTTTVISDKDIAKMGARNLADVLNNVAGINLHTGRKGYDTVDIRGMSTSSSYVKIYIDGIYVSPLVKINTSSGVDLRMYPVDSIAKIEVIKGPAPVTYGTDAIGGVILITTKNGKDYPGYKVSLVGGSNSTFNGAVSGGGGDAKLNYFFSAGSVHNDGYDPESNATLKQQFVNGKLNWGFKDGSQMTFVGQYSTTDKGCMNYYDPMTGKIISAKSGFWAGMNNWQFRDWDKTVLSLDYAKPLNAKLDTDFKIYHYRESQGLWANGADYDSSSGVNASKMGYSTTRWNASLWDSFMNGADWQNNWKMDGINTITFGASTYNIAFKSNYSKTSDPDNYTWNVPVGNKRTAAYLQDTITPNSKVTYTLGVREDRNTLTNTDYSTNSGSATDPSVNAVYQLDDLNTLRLAYGKTCGFPLLTQIFGSGTKIAPNADLKPEKANNYEIGLKHKFDAKTTGDIALFENDITNFIASVKLTGSTYSFQNKNFQWAKIKGAELNLDKKFDPRWNGFLNYTYLDTSELNYNYGNIVTQMQYAPRNHINYGLDYQMDKQYQLSLTGHWVPSDRFTNDTVGSDTRSVQKAVPFLGSYNILDFQIKRQVSATQDWYLKVYNVTNKQYSDELFCPADGRTFIVGVDCSF